MSTKKAKRCLYIAFFQTIHGIYICGKKMKMITLKKEFSHVKVNDDAMAQKENFLFVL